MLWETEKINKFLVPDGNIFFFQVLFHCHKDLFIVKHVRAYLNIDMYIISMSGVHESAGIGSPETRALDCCDENPTQLLKKRRKYFLSSELSGHLLHIFFILFY